MCPLLYRAVMFVPKYFFLYFIILEWPSRTPHISLYNYAVYFPLNLRLSESENISYPVFATPGTVARQAPLSLEFSKQEWLSGYLLPSPGDPPSPRDQTWVSCLAGSFFTCLSHQGSPRLKTTLHKFPLSIAIYTSALELSEVAKDQDINAKEKELPESWEEDPNCSATLKARQEQVAEEERSTAFDTARGS